MWMEIYRVGYNMAILQFFYPAERGGNYTLAVVANSATNTRSLYTDIIFVDKKDGNIPDGSTLLQPTLTRPGSTTIGSELIFSASYDDLDEDGISRVEFYLNGKLQHIDREKPFYFKFRPETDASILFTDRVWEVTAVGIDNSGNRIALTDEGNVQGSEILPEATVKSPLRWKSILMVSLCR